MYEDIISFNANVPADYPFKMHLAGISYCDGTYRIMRRNSPIYVFEYVESGCGYLRIDGNEFFPEAGDVYIAPYGLDHEYGSCRDKPWVKYWFNVSGRLVGDLLGLYDLAGTHLFKNYPLKDSFIAGMNRLRENPTAASVLTGPEIILDLVLKLAAHREYLHEKKSVPQAAQKLRSFLDDKVFAVPVTVDEMCAHIKLSPAQVNRIFKHGFGQTPYQYLLNLKIAAARELLTASVKSVKEIALSLGFSDEYYFSNIFKKKNGLAPSHYRSAWRQTEFDRQS